LIVLSRFSLYAWSASSILVSHFAAACQDLAGELGCRYSSTDTMEKNLISEVMKEMGRKGGKAGGKKGAKARMEALTPKERTRIARAAAKARWSKIKKMTRPKKKP